MGKAVSNVFSGAAKAVTNVVKAVVQPVYNATLKQIPGVDQALVGLDKTVGQTIPGGWGTVASVATSFIPGGSPLLMGLSKTQLATGLGALTGSGVFNKGNQFNLMGAVAGGALAYGLSNLSEGLQEAGKATPPSGVSEVVEKARLESAPKSLTPTADAFKNIATDGSNIGNYYTPPVSAPTPVPGQLVPPSGFGALKDVAAGATKGVDVGGELLGGMYDKASGQFIGGLNPAAQAPSLLTEAPGFLDKLSTGTGNLLSGTGSSMADTGAGIKNLAGFGAQPGTQSAAYDALTSKFGAGSLGATIMGASGLSALQEQKNLLNEQLAQGNIAQDQYNQELKAIEDQEKTAREAVAASPFNPNPSVADITPGQTYYDRETPAETLYPKTSGPVYAKGGEVQHYFGGGISGNIHPMIQRIINNLSNTTSAQTSEGLPIMGGSINRIVNQLNGLESAPAPAPNPEQAAINFGTQAVANAPWLPNISYGIQDSPKITIGIAGLNRGRPDDLLYGKSQSSSLNYDLPKYAIGGVISDDYSGVGPLDQGFQSQQTAQTQPTFEQSPYGYADYANTTTYPQLNTPGRESTPNTFYQSGGSSGSSGAFPLEGQYGIVKMAAGGLPPRFLSGGGDGMSDSIPANIGGTQEARLADGEFVIPADVVSHLGNGSSKAGAKQLYSMMDRIRTARTGRKSQGKQVNPRKYMPA